MPTFSPLAVILIGLTSARPMPIAVLRQAPTAKNDRPRPADGGKNEINSDPGGGSLLEREIDHFSSVAIRCCPKAPKEWQMRCRPGQMCRVALLFVDPKA